MAGSKSTYLDNKLLDLYLSAVAFSGPATLYFALFTAAPNAGGGGTEVAGNAYARVAVVANTANFPAAAGGSKSNATVISWPTATGAWGTIVAMAVFDAAAAGNMLLWTTLTPKVVNLNDTVSIPIGNFTVTET